MIAENRTSEKVETSFWPYGFPGVQEGLFLGIRRLDGFPAPVVATAGVRINNPRNEISNAQDDRQMDLCQMRRKIHHRGNMPAHDNAPGETPRSGCGPVPGVRRCFQSPTAPHSAAGPSGLPLRRRRVTFDEGWGAGSRRSFMVSIRLNRSALRTAGLRPILTLRSRPAATWRRIVLWVIPISPVGSRNSAACW